MKFELKLAISSLIVAIELIPLYAQPNVALIRNYDVSGHDSFQDVYVVSDGGLIACGACAGSGMGSSGDALVIRLDANGRQIWEYRTEIGSQTIAYSVVEADNGDFVVGSRNNSQFSATRLSSEGEVIWIRDYIGGTCEGVIELKNGDFMLCGHSGGGRIIYITPEGEAVWSRSYGGQYARFYGLRESDESAVVCGWGQSEWAIKVRQEDGDIEWSNEYQIGSNGGAALSIVSSGDGGFVLTGFAPDPYLLKIDGNGRTIWTQVYDYRDLNRGRDGNWEGKCITRLRDGGFAVVGKLWIRNVPEMPFCIRTDSRGTLRWESDYDFEGDENLSLESSFKSVITNPDNELISVGFAWNRQNQTYDALLMKTTAVIPNNLALTIMPEDTVFNVLLNDEVQFAVFWADNPGVELNHEWLIEDSLVSRDSTWTNNFDLTGEFIVECNLTFDELIITISWHVTVTDLFIAAHSPDPLDLTLRRGSIADFSIDSVAAIEGDDVQYQWTMNDLDRQEEVSGGDAQATSFDFTRSGRYIVEGMAYRGDSHDEVVWDVEVRGAIWSFLPEELNVERLEGDNVEFQIIPTVSDTVNRFQWYLDGMLEEGALDSVHSVHFVQLGEHTVTGILTDTLESDTVTWTILVESNSVPPSLSLEPSAFSLSASPNPFNSMLTIQFSAGSQAAPTRLAVYDLSGREVARLLDLKSEIRNQQSEIIWNASSFPAGVYLIRLQSGSDIQTMKVVLLR